MLNASPPEPPRHLGELIAGQLDRLTPIYVSNDEIAENLRRLLALLTAEALDRPAAAPFDGLSFINANGLPFQWLFSLSPRGHGFGFLCEVGCPGISVAARLGQTLDRLDAACRLIRGAAPGFLRDAAAILLPPADEPWPAHWRSAAWVGVSARDRTIGLKPYFNLNRGTCRERWLRVGWLLKALDRERALARFCALSTECSPDSFPVGLALDIMPDGAAGRVKIYFRSGPTTLAWLARWHQAAGFLAVAPELRRFLDLFGPVNNRTLPGGAMVVSLEIHADERLSLKTDLAVTKWTSTDGALFEAAASLRLGAAAETLAACRRALCLVPDGGRNGALLRFVGLGFEPNGSSHLNLYLEPPLTPPLPGAVARRRYTVRRTTAVTGAAQKGAAALLDALTDDHWEDFALPVGASDAWVTAYILAMLSDLPVHLGAPLRPGLTGPLAWLVERQRLGGGWGYNASVPDDADSTAWAIIALRGWGAPVPPDAVRFLKCCQQDVQFATYPAATSPARAWAAPAPDVSAVVRRALGLGLNLGGLAAPLELEPAYWWTSPLYTTAMMLDGISGPVSAELRGRLARIVPVGAFERALLVRAALRAGLPVDAWAAELIQQQRQDGLWPSAARLRLTHDMPEPPWERIDSGTLYTDARALFTTATAVAALGLISGERRS